MTHRILAAIRGNLVAWLALFVAMGGTSLAARSYLITSTKQIKPSVLKTLEGKVGPQGPAGPMGLPGASGTKGDTGPEGKPAPTTSLTAGPGILLSPNPIAGSGTISADTEAVQARITAACPAGEALTGVAQSGSPSCGAFLPTSAVFATKELKLNSDQGPILLTSGPFTIAAACDTGGGSAVSIEAYSSEAESVADVNTGTTMTFGGGAFGEPAAVLDETVTAGHFFSLQYTLAAPSGARLSGIISDGYRVLGSACVVSLVAWG